MFDGFTEDPCSNPEFVLLTFIYSLRPLQLFLKERKTGFRSSGTEALRVMFAWKINPFFAFIL